MADNLKISYNYLNPYEEYYNKFKTRSTYNKYTDEMFKRSANYGELDTIVYTLDELQRKTDAGEINFDDLAEEFNFELDNTDFAESVILNELHGDREKIVHYEEEVWNAELAKNEIRSYDMSEYELNKMFFKRTAEYNAEIDRLRQTQEAKDNRSGGMKFLSALGDAFFTIPYEILDGMTSAIDGVLSIPVALVNSARNEGDFFENFEKSYIGNKGPLTELISELSGNAEWKNEVQEWFGSWSHLRDVQGNYTTAGQWFGGTANSIGQMIPSMLVGKGLGKLGVPAKAVSTTQQALYYGGMSSNTFREFVNDPRLAGVSAGKKLARAATQTAVEWAVQGMLNKCFGPSMMDKVVFGYKGANKAIARVGTKSAIFRILGDAAHEGLEEMLQQYSNYFVDRLFAIGDENYEVTTEWDFSTAITAFGMGALSSIAMSTFSVIGGRVKKRIKGAVDTGRIKKAVDADVFSKLDSLDSDIKLLTEQIATLKNTPVETESQIAAIKAEVAKLQTDYDAKQAEATQLRSKYKLDKVTEKAYRDGEIVSATPKMNMLAEWGFKATIQDVMQEGTKLLSDKRLSNFERGQILGQMMVTMENIASIYGNVGQEIATNAQNLIKSMQESSEIDLQSRDRTGFITRKLNKAIDKIFGEDFGTTKTQQMEQSQQAYATMSSVIMEAISSMSGSYAQNTTSNLTEESKEEVREQTEKLTKEKQVTTEEAVQKLEQALGSDSLMFQNDGPEKVSTEKTIAKRITKQSEKQSKQKSKTDIAKQITTLIQNFCQEYKLTLEQYDSLPKEIKGAVENINTDMSKLRSKMDAWLKTVEQLTVDNARNLETQVDTKLVDERSKKIKSPDDTDAKQAIKTVKDIVIDEPVQALQTADSVDAIAKAVVDLALPKALMSNIRYRLAFDEIYRAGKDLLTRTDSAIDITPEYVMSALLLDTDFVHNLVQISSNQVIEFLDGLHTILENASTDTAIDRQIRERLKNAEQTIKSEIAKFAMEVSDLKPELLKMFDSNEAKRIQRYRIGSSLVYELKNSRDIEVSFDIRNGQLKGIAIGTIKSNGDIKNLTGLGNVIFNALNSSSDVRVKKFIKSILDSGKSYFHGGQDIDGKHTYSDASVLSQLGSILESVNPKHFVNKYNTGEYFQNNNTENIIANTFFEKNNITRHSFSNNDFVQSMLDNEQFIQQAKNVFGTLNYTDDITSKREFVFNVFNELFKISNGNTYELFLSTDTNGKLNFRTVQVRYIGSNDRAYKTMFTNDGNMLSLMSMAMASQDIKTAKSKSVRNPAEFATDLNLDDSIATFIDISQRTNIAYDEVTGYDSYAEYKEIHFESHEVDFISSDISAQERATLTMSDILTNLDIDKDGNYTSKYLSKDIQKSIIDTYGELIPQTIFSYLHEYFLQMTHGTTTIVLGKDGKIYTIDIHKLESLYTGLHGDTRDIKKVTVAKLEKLKNGDRAKLRDVLPSQFLSPALADVDVVIDDNLKAYGSYSNNVITINSKLCGPYVNFTLLHEYRHAVQDYFNLNGGFGTCNLFDVDLGTYILKNIKNLKTVTKMISDLKDLLHIPTEAKAKEQWYTQMLGEKFMSKNKRGDSYNYNNLNNILLSNFIYYTSGEAEAFAYNISYNQLFAPYAALYPTIVDAKNGIIILPNGKKYELLFDVTAREDVNANIYDYDVNNSMLTYSFAIMTQNGKIKVNSNYSSLSDYQSSNNSNFNNSICIVNNSGNGNVNYSIFVNCKTITRSQYDSTVDFINKVLNGNGVVTLTSTDNDFSITIDKDAKFTTQQALTQIGVFMESINTSNIVMLEEVIDTSERLKEIKDDALIEEAKSKDKRRKPNRLGIRTTRKNDVYVSKDIAGNTPAKYLVGRQVNKQVVDFAIRADLDRLNPELAEYIRTGKISLEGTYGIYKWLRKEGSLDPNDPTSQYTLDLLNKSIFKNKYIDSPEVLLRLAYIGMAEYYALRRVMRIDGQQELFDATISAEDLQLLINRYSTDPKYKTDFEKFVTDYNKDYHSSKGTDVVSTGTLKVRLLQKFDGSIDSGYDIAKRELTAAKLGFKHDSDFNTRSLDENVGKLKHGSEGGDLQLAEVIADTSNYNNMDPASQLEFRETIAEYIVEFLVDEKFEDWVRLKQSKGQVPKTLTDTQRTKLQDAYEQHYIDTFSKWSKDQLVEQLATIAESGWLPKQFRGKTEQVNEKSIKSTIKSVKSGISTKAKQIASFLRLRSEHSKKAFLSRYGDLFNEDYSLKSEVYQGSWTESQLPRYVELNNKLSKIAYEVRNGRFDHGEKGVKAYDSQIKAKEKSLEKLAERIDKFKVREAKYKKKIESLERTIQQLQIGGNNFTVTGPDSDAIPQVFRAVMETTWTRFAKTNVQLLADADEQHVVQSMNEFMKTNAETLAAMSYDEARDVAKFLANNLIVPTEAHSATEAASLTQRYQLYAVWFNTYLLALNDAESRASGNALLDADTVKGLENFIKSWETHMGRGFGSINDVIKTLKPFKTIVDAFAQQSKMEEFFADYNSDGEMLKNKDGSPKSTELDELSFAIRKNNQVELQVAINKLQRKGWERWAKINGRDGKSLDRFLDRFWKFQRMAMLSSPGTWGRNVISNTAVKGLNAASDAIGKLFTKLVDAKHGPIEGQWRMDVKPTAETDAWITREFFEKYDYVDYRGKDVKRSMYDILSDGLTKWTAASDKRFNLDEELAKLPKLTDQAKMDANELAAIRNAYTDILTNMIGESIRTDIFMKGQFGSSKAGKALNKVSQILFKFLSDDPWIRSATKKYFGKILQESINDGKISIEGLNAKPDTVEFMKTKLQTLQLFSKAYTLAAHDYMHRTNFITQLERQLSGKSKTAMFLYKQFLPFASAAWNWFTEGLNYTPMGLVKAVVDYARLEKKIAKAETKLAQGKYTGPDISFIQYLTKRNIGKGIIGTVGFGIGLLLAGFGVLAIDDEDDKIKISIGNIKVDISDIFGTSSLLAGAAMVSVFRNEGNFWGALSAMNNQFLEDSIFTDLHMMFSYDSVGDAIVPFIQNKISTIVPNIIKNINKLLYVHTPQYSSGMMGQFERWGSQIVPGLVYAFPRRFDPYTGEYQLKYANGITANWFQKFAQVLGVKIYEYNFSDVEAEAAAQGVRRGELTCRYEDIGNFDSDAKAKANEYYGSKNKKDLEELYSNKTKYKVFDKKTNKYVEVTYSKMTTEQKKAVIERIMTNNSKLAKIYTYTQILGGKYYASADEYKELTKLGIKKNVYKENNKQKGFIS